MKQSDIIAKEVAEITEASSSDRTDLVEDQGSPPVEGVWSARADAYFEREFEEPFSGSEEEEGWSGSSEDSPQGPAKSLTTVDVVPLTDRLAPVHCHVLSPLICVC